MATTAAQLIRASRRCLYSNSTLQSFGPSSNMTPIPEAGLVPRSFKGKQGMDMRKLCSYGWIDAMTPYHRIKSGYSVEMAGNVSIHAPTAEDIATHFATREYWRYYTVKEMFSSLTGHMWPQIYYVVGVGAVYGVMACVCFYFNMYEPKEFAIDPSEFWENAEWHVNGLGHDHHAFAQYMEARRAKRYRHLDVDPVEYIPAEFRSEAQIERIGKGKPLHGAH